jgi:hypothetical protein
MRFRTAILEVRLHGAHSNTITLSNNSIYFLWIFFQKYLSEMESQTHGWALMQYRAKAAKCGARGRLKIFNTIIFKRWSQRRVNFAA